MELNPDIFEMLKAYKIDKSEGTLFLLGVYFELDAERVCSEETVKAINLTKIIEKDFKTKTIQWNVPLFAGQETAFDWIEDWIKPFGEMNPERRGLKSECTRKMKQFFAANPELRMPDIYAARNAYFKTVKDMQYLKAPHNFIFEGKRYTTMSELLRWCNNTKVAASTTNQKGRVIQ